MKKEKLRTKQFMRNKRSFILLTILSMGIGFAYLTSNLTITGNTAVSGNSWKVYFTNVQVSEGSVEASVAPTATGTDTTSIDYTILLDKPGDFYEFTVDVVNAGTIDAMIESIATIDGEEYYEYLPHYLNYTVEYVDGGAVSENQLLVANSTDTYKVRIEFRKEIRAEDLEEEDMNLNLTFGVNYKQSNLRTTNFTKLVSNRMVSDKNLDFENSYYYDEHIVNDGLFLMNSTAQNQYPIYYYRGDVENNYAKFAGYCWKIVRTTETGGTKLIYNGTPRETYAEFSKIDRASYTDIGSSQQYPYTYDSTTKEWSISSITYDPEADYSNEEYDEETWDYYYNGGVDFEFSVAEAGDYVLKFNMTDGMFYHNIGYGFTIDWNELDYKYSEKTHEGYVELFNLTPEKKISIRYLKQEDEYGYDNNAIFHFSVEKGVGSKVHTCDNTKENAQLSTQSKYNENDNSPAYVGYMYGTVYETKEATYNSSHVYGNSFTYSNGTYTLKDTNVGADDNHHYTCFNTGGTCTKIAYVFYKSGSKVNYLEIANGKSIEDAFSEMNTNTNNSTFKTAIDNWFNNTFKTYFTTNSKDYNNYLEDTVWCNDRSFPTMGYSSTQNNNFKPNGGSVSYYYAGFAFEGRKDEDTPSLVCSNKNDSFTVSDTTNGNGALTYPVGLLTADELVFAGASNSSVNSNYLSTNSDWLTMTPAEYGGGNGAFVYSLGPSFGFSNESVDSKEGVRPSISINKDVRIASGGDGTALHPYEFVVE